MNKLETRPVILCVSQHPAVQAKQARKYRKIVSKCNYIFWNNTHKHVSHIHISQYWSTFYMCISHVFRSTVLCMCTSHCHKNATHWFWSQTFFQASSLVCRTCENYSFIVCGVTANHTDNRDWEITTISKLYCDSRIQNIHLLKCC